MIKYPIILVVSEGNETPENIIEKIRKQSSTEDIDALTTTNLTGYRLHLTTKYYQTDLYLVPFKDNISLLPAEIEEAIEGVLIYFDSGKRSFSGRIPIYADFLKKNEIELGILLCDRLYDDSNEGITYKEAKQASRFLDVIELGRTREEGEEDDPHDPIGYDELMQALRSFLWSNVQMDGATSRGSIPLTENISQNPTASSEEQAEELQENAIETELEIFEKLLTEVMQFTNSSTHMSRNERLAHAQQFADKFESLIGEGENSSDEG